MVVVTPEVKQVYRTFAVHYSPIVVIGVDLLEMTNIDSSKPHCFAGLQFFQDSDGLIDASPTGGLAQITISSVNNAPNFEVPPTSLIRASASVTITWAANTQTVLCTIGTTFSGGSISHYRLVVTCNET